MTAPWFAAAATVAYLLATVGAFRLIDWGVPAWLESVLSALATPGVLALLVWAPLLKRLGLARGEMVTVPSPLAFALICVLYAVIAFGVASLVVRLLHR